jgi:hypothetical protein
MFDSDTHWLCSIEWWNACGLCMHVYLFVCYYFPAIESNEECTKEGGVFEY